MTQDVDARSTQQEEKAPARERLPYVPPQVRSVGSVRELTMGSGGTHPDGGPGKGHPGKG
jgi:hypothetical protein